MQTLEKEAGRSSREPPASFGDCHSGADTHTAACQEDHCGADPHVKDPTPEEMDIPDVAWNQKTKFSKRC